MPVARFLTAALFLSIAFCAFGYDWNTNPGHGTEADPYQLSEPNQLLSIASDPNLLGKCFLLMNDIIFDPNNNPERIFTSAIIAPDVNDLSLGFDGMAFSGIFDGNHYGISNLTFNVDESVDYLGLFGYTEHAIIKNICITNVSMTLSGSRNRLIGGLIGVCADSSVSDCSITGSISADDTDGGTIGGLAGFHLDSDLMDCQSTIVISGDGILGGLVGLVRGGTITNCHTLGAISGADRIGGLAGSVGNCIVSDCSSQADVQGVYWIGGLAGVQNDLCFITRSCAYGQVIGQAHVGGLVGGQYNTSTITQCFAAGTVISTKPGTMDYSYSLGGLAGSQAGLIQHCYATGCIVSSGFRCYEAGGLVGFQSGTIRNCYSTGQVDTSLYCGGLIGEGTAVVINCFWDTETSQCFSSGGGKGRMTAQLQSPDNYVAWNAPGETVWVLREGMDYPRLAWEATPGQPLTCQLFEGIMTRGSGTPDDPYQIETPEQLNAIGLFPDHWDKAYVLNNDLDMSGYTNTDYNRIGLGSREFTGSFNGGGHIISNLSYMTGAEQFVGMFGWTLGSTIKNLGLDNVLMVSDVEFVGGLAGYHQGGIMENCYAVGSARTDEWHVGGLVGADNRSTIRNCYADGTVYGTGYVGGLVGSQIDHFSSRIENCYSAALVTSNGDYNVGALLGEKQGNSSFVLDCFWLEQIGGPIRGIGNFDTDPVGTTGLDGVQMKRRLPFISSGWDFVSDDNGNRDIWRMCNDGVDLPRLSWEFGDGDYACGAGVNLIDFAALSANWLTTEQTQPETFNIACDGNLDGRIDLLDLMILADHWLES